MVTEVLAKANRHQREVKGIQIGKEEVQVFEDDMIVHISEPKISSRELYS